MSPNNHQQVDDVHANERESKNELQKEKLYHALIQQETETETDSETDPESVSDLESEESDVDLDFYSNERSSNQARKLWRQMIQQSNNTTGTCTIKNNNDTKIIQALSSIRILNDSTIHESWLDEHDGKLDTLPFHLIEALQQCAPENFHARVADFNDNLFYAMQEQYGLSHLLNLPCKKKEQCHQQEQCTSKIMHPDDILQTILHTKQFLGSYLATETTTPQPPHVDFTWERLEKHGDDLRIGFFPLTNDGMFLQIWSRDDNFQQRNIEGEIIFIPCGKLLTLPATTIHGGGFRTTTAKTATITPESNSNNNDHGNLRFHLYVANNGAELSKNQTTNKYTEPGDKRKELADRYVNTPMMDELMKCLFVVNDSA